MNDKEAEKSQGAAGRALDVFEVFAALHEPMSLTELSARIEAPLSTCHNLVRVLQLRGYVYALDHPRRFYPSKRIFEIASAIATHDPIVQRVLPILTALRDATGETVIIGKRQGDEVIYLEVIEGTHLIRYREEPGARKPLHSSAIGKAVLGSMDDDALAAFLRGRTFAQKTDRTIVAADRLLQDLSVSRERGYYMTVGENVSEVEAIAIVTHMVGQTLAIALAGPISRMQEHQAALVTALRTCQLEIDKANVNRA